MSTRGLRSVLAQLVLLLPTSKFEAPDDSVLESLLAPTGLLLKGLSSQLLTDQDYKSLLFNAEASAALSQFPASDMRSVVHQYVKTVVATFLNALGAELAPIHLQLVAIALLQVYIQNNFTGPCTDYSSHEMFFGSAVPADVHLLAVRLLNIDGQQAYELMQDPVFLVIACALFEHLSGVSAENTLLGKLPTSSVDDIAAEASVAVQRAENDPVLASLLWWRARALQVHHSVLSEGASTLSSVTFVLLVPSVANALAPATDTPPLLQKHVQLAFFVESARNNIHAQTEHLATPFLARARELSGLSFVLTGAKAKRTKFQKFHTSNLIVLAKSAGPSLLDDDARNDSPEAFVLDSDLLLEKPHFESLDDLEMADEPNSKRFRFDPTPTEVTPENLLPIAARQDDIPELKALDPNKQPLLTDTDTLQLLLRLATLRQTLPSSNLLVEEELMALVTRLIYTSEAANWLLFGRALWERSVLETNKARTIERGILQMTALVEEIGIKVKARVIPEACGPTDGSMAASRLRFIHQLPLMPLWAMDVKLAEKYMSLGIIRSAIDIYERLSLVTDAALCYAAVDNEAEAERLLRSRIEAHPDDARAISVLGDVMQDPELWERAWKTGRYAKAKASLSRYYYSPPRLSGLERNVELAIAHMHDCLTANPLVYENWFFYGCCGLESEQYGLALEAFTRCVSLDDTNSYAWLNLATALLRTDKTKPAFNALKKALRTAGEGKKSWRIYENYLVVAAKLGEWSDVLIAARELVLLKDGELSIDIPVIEKLVEILVATELPTDGGRLTHYQRLCTEFVCEQLPSVINTSARCWRIVSRVELWRQRPWAALECHEKAYRAVSHRPELETDELVWNEAVDACEDLVAAYESLGEKPGKHGAGDVVCKDWKYKTRTTVRSLMSKGKAMWEDSEGWVRLQQMKEDAMN